MNSLTTSRVWAPTLMVGDDVLSRDVRLLETGGLCTVCRQRIASL